MGLLDRSVQSSGKPLFEEPATTLRRIENVLRYFKTGFDGCGHGGHCQLTIGLRFRNCT
jgi:hypothetical protein